MAVDFIGASAGATQQVDTQLSTLGQDEFLKVLLTQLNFQDPLKPMDNQQFLAQMAQFSALAQTQQLNSRIDTLLSIQASTQAVGVLGRTVEVTGQGGSGVGEVTALSFASGQPQLTVKFSDGSVVMGIGLSQVSLVR